MQIATILPLYVKPPRESPREEIDLPLKRKDVRGAVWSAQADLRIGGVSRLAINAARRALRVQGSTVPFCAAVSMTDLIKRVLVFMARLPLSLLVCDRLLRHV